MTNKLTTFGPKETPKLIDRGPAVKGPIPEKKPGLIPSKPQFQGLSMEAAESLGSGQREERTLGGSTGAAGFLKLQADKERSELALKSQASKALFAQNTVAKPMLSYAVARQKLEAFFEEAKNVTPAQLSSLAGARPELLDAALDFLAYRFTPIGFGEVGGDPEAKKPTQVAQRLVQEMDPARKTRFVESVVFNVAHPANHQALWPQVLASISPTELEKALLDKAGGANELHALNAFSLPFHVYGRRPDFTLGGATRAKLVELADERRSAPNANLLLRQSLEDLALPTAH